VNDLDKRRYEALKKRQADYSAASDKHTREGIKLAREANKLFTDWQRFWARQKGGVPV
jgi:hypothetical protein